MKKHLSVSLLTLAATVLPLSAQEITKEITIEREIVPEVRAASRINLPVSVISPDVRQKTLTFSERAVAAPITPMISTMDPVIDRDAVEQSPYRGYVSAGYFPTVNAGVSAGYRLVNTRNTSLGIWAQYDGNSYKYDSPSGGADKVKLSTQTVTAGANLLQRFGNAGVLTLDGDFMYDRFNCPWVVPNDSVMGVYRFNVNGLWNGRVGAVSYKIGAGVSNIAYTEAAVPKGFKATGFDSDGRPVDVPYTWATHEFGFKLFGAVDWQFSSVSSLNIGVGFENYNRNVYSVAIYQLDEEKFYGKFPVVKVDRIFGQYNGNSHGVLRFDPGVDFRAKKWSARVGASVYVGTGRLSTINLAPDLSFAWTPFKFLSFSASCRSDYRLNSLSEIYDISRYLLPYGEYGRSFAPIVADLSIAIGPFRGASLELFGSYAHANDWITLEAVERINSLGFDKSNGFKVGARASYEFRDIVKASVSYEFVPEPEKHSYYSWLDHADREIRASLDIHPFKQLTVNADYTFRGGRSMTVFDVNQSTSYPSALTAPMTEDLGDISNLSVGAGFAFTDAFSVFGRVDNVLSSDYDILRGIPARGISGLVGVSYKF